MATFFQHTVQIWRQISNNLPRFHATFSLVSKGRFPMKHERVVYLRELLKLACSELYGWSPGAPHTYFNDGGVRQRFIFYTQKNPNFRICLPKKNPYFFSIPKKIPQCFYSSKCYYLSSGKLKHAYFNFGFGQKQNYKLRLCYFWFELMKNTIPKKIPVLFSRPKKIPASFIDPKKSLLAKMSDPKKSFGPPRH